MDTRESFSNLSALDHRYWQANQALFDELSCFLSEKANIRYMCMAEVALLKIHVKHHFQDRMDLLQAIDKLPATINIQQVIEEEERTQHNTRALVNVIQRNLPKEIAPWVHLGATSADIIDTATSMRLRDVMQRIVIPLLLDVLDILVKICTDHAGTIQIGRTHGQFAVPITFGYAMAEYVSRIGQSVGKLKNLAGDLRGKLSGAVGAYHATSMICDNPQKLEDQYLEELGLKRAGYANQIVEPEHQLRLLLETNLCFGVLANLADDLRHLQRSEIAEVSESFGEAQVGSSTMPQKRNPWNSEHVKSLWKTFSPRVMTFYMDQISEHQRDLSNSASGRFVADYIAGFVSAVARMKKILAGLQVHKERMKQNLSGLSNQVLAEPTYILLAIAGYSDAHEIVRKATLDASLRNISLKNILMEQQDIWHVLEESLGKIAGLDAQAFYSSPETYLGMAKEKALGIASLYHKTSHQIRVELEV